MCHNQKLQVVITYYTLVNYDCKIWVKQLYFLTKRTSVSSDHDKEAICNRMVLVCGTSTCHMAVSRSKLFIPGVWGPFWSGTLYYFLYFMN